MMMIARACVFHMTVTALHFLEVHAKKKPLLFFLCTGTITSLILSFTVNREPGPHTIKFENRVYLPQGHLMD